MAANRPKGTRDFLPETMAARQQVIQTVRKTFELFGFGELQTPAFERIETLTGKYGDETDKLMFKIIKRGSGSENGECDMALRYDLTVPLARVMAMNPDIRTPFKRYQIQPVWRAERAQRGRFREFYQCDVDIVGATGALAEAECLAVMYRCFVALGLPLVNLHINDRRVLSDLAAIAGAEDTDAELKVLIAIDKLDKIGRQGVTEELIRRGFVQEKIDALFAAIERPEQGDAILTALSTHLTPRGQEGITAIRALVDATVAMGVPAERLVLDPTLARGADYYTGPVFEAQMPALGIGSLGGGGRYDTLIGRFSKQDLPTVGVSIGLERVLVVLEEQGLLPTPGPTAKVLVTLFNENEITTAISTANMLRDAGIATDLYLEPKKLKAQFKYAHARGYPFLIVIGPDEAANNSATLRNLETGEQTTVAIAELAHLINR
jgi:histidyl-tRNA synthetase